VADTQFVAIAGIGPDAAEYAAEDQAVAGKLGAFGYDRITKLSDIKDKLSETIIVLQVPPMFKRPWLAGGGSTVMGVPETGTMQPFVCPNVAYNNKPGTFAIMADCSVRFIPATLPYETFKAMCTIKGGESVELGRDVPVVPPPEGQPELKAVEPSPVPSTPKTETPQATGPTVKLEWKEFRSGGGGFSILLPGYPTEQRKTFGTPGSPQGSGRVYDLETQGVSFSIMVLDLPAVYPSSEIPQRLDAGASSMAQTLGGKVLNQRNLTYAGFPGIEFDLDVPSKGTGRARACIAKQRLYVVLVGPKDKLSAQDLDKFFDSLKIDVPAAEAAPEAPKQGAAQPGGGSNDQAVAALARNCGQCHTGRNAKGKPNPIVIFTNPGVLNPNAPKRDMEEAISGGKMPPPAKPRPSQQDLAAIQTWLNGK
jgi:hypothetical protein